MWDRPVGGHLGVATWGLSQGISLGHYLATLTVFISKAADWGVGEKVISQWFLSHCSLWWVYLFTPCLDPSVFRRVGVQDWG